MNNIDFNLLLNKKTDEINNLIDSFLPIEEGYQKSVFEAVNYSIKAGGKRIRPLFMMEIFLVFSSKDCLRDEAIKLVPNFMAAIEMIHTYSLVHDDLPAMDNDRYRRGKLTTHAKYGEALGILSGDGLLNLAYETALGAFYNIDEKTSAVLYKRILTALNILSKKAGIYGMIGGQTVDVEKSGRTSDIKELEFIYKLKTAALLEASITVGAVLGGADEETVDKLNLIANDIGMAFQIQDDILDVIGDEILLGKSILSDEKNDKTTYVTLFSLDAAKNEVDRLSKHSIQELDKLMDNMDCDIEKRFLIELILSLINRKK